MLRFMDEFRPGCNIEDIMSDFKFKNLQWKLKEQ